MEEKICTLKKVTLPMTYNLEVRWIVRNGYFNFIISYCFILKFFFSSYFNFKSILNITRLVLKGCQTLRPFLYLWTAVEGVPTTHIYQLLRVY